MKIEKVGKTRYQELIELWEASVKASHDFLSEEDIIYFRKRIFETYFDLVELYGYFDDQNKIQGFLGLSNDKIEMLFVMPGKMGKGIGKALLINSIQEKGICKVDVNEQNPKAVGFYESMGFKVIRRNKLDAEGKPFPILEMELK